MASSDVGELTRPHTSCRLLGVRCPACNIRLFPKHLKEAGVTVKPYEALLPELRSLKPEPSPPTAPSGGPTPAAPLARYTKTSSIFSRGETTGRHVFRPVQGASCWCCGEQNCGTYSPNLHKQEVLVFRDTRASRSGGDFVLECLPPCIPREGKSLPRPVEPRPPDRAKNQIRTDAVRSLPQSDKS